GREDVRQDGQDVDRDEDVDERLDRADRVEHHAAPFVASVTFPTSLVTDCYYAWLKKPPRSNIAARCSAETSTLRGVSRKTLSATRCMPPFSAYVSPLAKSISRLESSASALCRLRMTGIPCLKRSAICCASLKLRGSTRCTRTLDGVGTASMRGTRDSAARVRCSRALRAGVGAGSSSDSVQSSKS